MNETASVLEVLAAAFNVLGILVAVRMYWLTMQRYSAVLATGGTQAGPRGLAAFRHVRCEIGRIVYHVIALGLGAWAMALPDPTSAYGQIMAWSRLILALLFTVFSVMDLMSDSRLAGMLSDRRPDARGQA